MMEQMMFIEERFSKMRAKKKKKERKPQDIPPVYQ
jgi:hypothetical protein